jgi:DNA invertase Pin-like site-specific DNA recombinase
MGEVLIFHVMAALAQFERRLIAERSRAGIAAARKRGKHLGRPADLTLGENQSRPADDRQRGTIGFRHGEAARRSPRHAAQGIEEQAW